MIKTTYCTTSTDVSKAGLLKLFENVLSSVHNVSNISDIELSVGHGRMTLYIREEE